MHEHFDADGNPCRAADAFTTVVTREAEWDEESRGRAMRLAEYETSLCPCGCGLPLEQATDKNAVMRVETFTCASARAIAVAKRADAEKHKGDKPNPRDGSKWDDGRNYYAVPHDDD